VQAYYQWPQGQPATVRAMAILPGGKGDKGSGPGCNGATAPSMKVPSSPGTSFTSYLDPDNTTASPIHHRSDVQCWKQKGRALYFVDVETGQLIKKIFDNDTSLTNGTIFPSPLTGSPTAYQDAVSTVATEAFVMDADGVLWRIDLTDTDPHPAATDGLLGWTVRPFHDLFWDRSDPTDDETSYERPILSLDDKRRLVIITGTGDSDNFDKPTVKNKVVSLTELTTSTTPSGPADYVAAINWELVPRTDNGFAVSELVTGQMSLFQSQLYIASFISIADPSQPCSYGRGRLWSFDYTKRDPTDNNPPSASGIHTNGPLRLAVVDSADNSASSGANLFNVSVAAAEQNLLIQGLGTTQRPVCVVADETNLGNYYSPGSSMVPIVQQSKPAIWIVAQASSNNTARKRAGSLLGSLEMKVDRPQALSRVMSWAGSIE
jgi:hypothetical protein